MSRPPAEHPAPLAKPASALGRRLLLAFVLGMLVQRHLVRGLTLGAVRG